MKNITIGRYVPGNSITHKLDPRMKFILMTAFIFFVFSSSNFYALGFSATFVLSTFVISGQKLKRVFKMLKPLRWMFLFLMIINFLTFKQGVRINTIFGQEEIFGINIYNLNLYEDAFFRTVLVLSKIMLMIMVSTILTATTKPIDLTIALEKILKPYLFVMMLALGWYVAIIALDFDYASLEFGLTAFISLIIGFIILFKFPILEIAMMISLALRFIPTLLEETDKIMKAQASRGADFENGKFKEKIISMVTLIVPLFASAFQKAAELSDAMDSRGYVVGKKRVRYKILRFKFKDFFALVVVGGFVSTIIWSNTLAEALI